MKVSFVYDDGYVIQLQFAFRSSLRNGVPCMEREVLHGKLFWRIEPLNFTAWCRQRRFDFSGLSPYMNYHHSCGYFSFVRFLSVTWSYNHYTYNFSCGDILIYDWTCYTIAGHWSTRQAGLPHAHKHTFIGCQFTFHITDGLSWTLLKWDHAWIHFALCSCLHDRMHYVRTLVYSTKCGGYCCVHNLPV